MCTMISTSLSVSLLLSVTRYDETKNHFNIVECKQFWYNFPMMKLISWQLSNWFTPLNICVSLEYKNAISFPFPSQYPQRTILTFYFSKWNEQQKWNVKPHSSNCLFLVTFDAPGSKMKTFPSLYQTFVCLCK